MRPLPLLLVGCSPPLAVVSDPPEVWSAFPFDGERSWTYENEDPAVPYALVASSDGVAERWGEYAVYTVRYERVCTAAEPGCDDGPSHVIRWSSDRWHGIWAHAYGIGPVAGAPVERPIQVAHVETIQLSYDNMWVGDDLTTDAGGAEWTSTLDGFEDCPTRLSRVITDCAGWTLDVSPGDGRPLAGRWWAKWPLGVTAFQGPDEGRWELSQWSCTPDAECDGDW